jgi:hypothetical protein
MPQQPQPQTKNSKVIPKAPKLPRRKIKKQQIKYEDSEDSEDSGDSEDNLEFIPKQNKMKQKKVKKLHTSIDDLESSSQSEDNISKKRPPVAIRSGVGAYDISNEFGKLEETNRNVSSGHTKNSTAPSVGTGNDLMAAAMAMQKEREKTDVKSPSGLNGLPNQRPV